MRRAIGEYAEMSGTKDAKKLPDKFLQAVEGFDFTLFQAKRNDQPVGSDSDKALEKALQSIDRQVSPGSIDMCGIKSYHMYIPVLEF